MERPIKGLTEDEVNEYRLIKAALDAGATVKRVKDGEGGIYLRGRKLSTKEVMDCIFNPDFKPTMTNADRIRSMTDEELAKWIWTSVAWQIQNYRHDEQVQTDDEWLDWLKQETEDA